uniref:Uncharacterized protein n=1 Tax=Strigamia maritima TaxID=126957 RepID=T1IP77_STRMM
MEDYTDIILLSRDLLVHKEEANTLECDKMRMKRCIEKLRQDVSYENINLERDKKRLKKGQQTYAKLCNAKSELHKTFLEKERLKQTMDEDSRQLRYKITTMSNQLEMEQADIQKLALEDVHEDEFDENCSNEIIVNLETTGQELILYAQDLFSLNKKIKQSAWRLKYLSCQLTADSITCDLSSDDEEAYLSDSSKGVQTSTEVQATVDQHSLESQASYSMTIKAVQTNNPEITSDFVQTSKSNTNVVNKTTEIVVNTVTVSTQTDNTSTPRMSLEQPTRPESRTRFGSQTRSANLTKPENLSRPESLTLRAIPAQMKSSEEKIQRSSSPEESPRNPEDFLKSSKELLLKLTSRKFKEEIKSLLELPIKTLGKSEEEIKSLLELPTAASTQEESVVNVTLDNPHPFYMEMETQRITNTWKDHFLAPCPSTTQNKITQTVPICPDDEDDFSSRCVDQMSQTASCSQSIGSGSCVPICIPNCLPNCLPTCSPCSSNCQSMYQSFYANSPRLSPMCYTNDCSSSSMMMMYSRDCTPTYCNLSLSNQAPVRECASPPEQLGSLHSTPGVKEGEECCDLQSDQYPTKDETDMKMKSTPNFVHYPYQSPNHMPASYPTIPLNRNQNPAEIWQQVNELPNQDYPLNCSNEHYFNPNLPTQDTRKCLNSTSSQSNRDDSYYQVNVSPPEDCWTEIQSRFTGLLSLYTSDQTVNSDSDLDSLIQGQLFTNLLNKNNPTKAQAKYRLKKSPIVRTNNVIGFMEHN